MDPKRRKIQRNFIQKKMNWPKVPYEGTMKVQHFFALSALLGVSGAASVDKIGPMENSFHGCTVTFVQGGDNVSSFTDIGESQQEQ